MADQAGQNSRQVVGTDHNIRLILFYCLPIQDILIQEQKERLPEAG